ncbi:MAG: hypothetical protein U0841_32915 [Chloroflexia bacterium]
MARARRASALLRGALAELRETGVALATLFPSTLPVTARPGSTSGVAPSPTNWRWRA